MVVYPSYYESFRCIADRCRHNCCIGWEIDVDEETAARYLAEQGNFGKRLKSNICYEDGVYSFRLGAKERCPFLGPDNLCDIIKTLGEDALCEICHLHPRYRNFYTDREEIGLGLACEEATRLILSSTAPTVLVSADGIVLPDGGTQEEREFFRLRDGIFACLQDRTRPFAERVNRLEKAFSLQLEKYSRAEWVRVFSHLECLDPYWKTCLGEIGEEDWLWPQGDLSVPAEQLAFTFVYRHFSKVLEGNSASAVISFCLLSVRLIGALWHSMARRFGGVRMEDMVEVARMYSAEIEYSTDNTDALLVVFEE